MKNKNLKTYLSFFILSIILVVVFLWDLNTGNAKVPFNELLKFILPWEKSSDEYYLLIREFRFSRVSMAFIAGTALSVSGLLMQTIFRNPLAGPYVLGISSGAGLGVALVVLGTGFLSFSLSSITIIFSAIIGSAAVLLIILAISMRMRDTVSILIIGILLSGVIGSIISILQYYAADINVKSYVIWTMGSLSSVSFSDIKLIFPITLFFSFTAFILSKKLNLLLPGESFAITMGVNLKLIRIFTFIIVSILTGVVTAFCGPLGFIGIAVPHIARWLFNSSNHFVIIPASFIIGGIVMLFSDILTHVFVSQGIIPVNSITAIIGAPVVVWIVVKNKRVIV